MEWPTVERLRVAVPRFAAVAIIVGRVLLVLSVLLLAVAGFVPAEKACRVAAAWAEL